MNDSAISRRLDTYGKAEYRRRGKVRTTPIQRTEKLVELEASGRSVWNLGPVMLHPETNRQQGKWRHRHRPEPATIGRASEVFVRFVRRTSSPPAEQRSPAPQRAVPGPARASIRGCRVSRTRAGSSPPRKDRAWSALRTGPPPAPRSPLPVGLPW